MKNIAGILGALLFIGLPASAQLPPSEPKQAMASASVAFLVEYPQCEPGIEVVNPIVPYLAKEVNDAATDRKFWDQIREGKSFCKFFVSFPRNLAS